MRCYFCGSTIGVGKIKITGKENGKRRRRTIPVCSGCSAMGDDRWMEEQLLWDDNSLRVVPVLTI